MGGRKEERRAARMSGREKEKKGGTARNERARVHKGRPQQKTGSLLVGWLP